MLVPALPACGSVLDFKIGNDLAAAINDDDIMMIVCPVEADIISNLLPLFHFWLSG